MNLLFPRVPEVVAGVRWRVSAGGDCRILCPRPDVTAGEGRERGGAARRPVDGRTEERPRRIRVHAGELSFEMSVADQP